MADLSRRRRDWRVGELRLRRLRIAHWRIGALALNRLHLSMKTFGLLSCFLIIAFHASAQASPSVVKAQALEMGRALVNGDTKTFAKYMLPEMISAGGGEDKVNFMMDSAFAIFKTFGGSVKKITYGNPGKIISYKNEWQTTLPQTTEVTSPFADIELSSTLVAISRDNGKNWYFFDTSMEKVDQLKNKLPNLSPDLPIPPPIKPKITPKEQ